MRARQRTRPLQTAELGERTKELVIRHRCATQAAIWVGDNPEERIRDQIIESGLSESQILGWELIGIKIWIAVHQSVSPHTGVTNFEDRMVPELVLKIHAPLLCVADRVRAFRPDLTGALPNLRQCALCASHRLE